MNFNRHSNLEGCHAFLGASKYHWLNYTDEKLALVFTNMMAAQRGTELHAFAAQAIKLGQKLPRSNKALNAYVNDAIDGLNPSSVLSSPVSVRPPPGIWPGPKSMASTPTLIRMSIIPAGRRRLSVLSAPAAYSTLNASQRCCSTAMPKKWRRSIGA